MKKSELTQLTQIIEVLVTREVRKQLPKLIGEVFSNMTGKAMVMENVHKEVPIPDPIADPHEFKASLKDLFAGNPPVRRTELEEAAKPAPQKVMRTYTKDPVLNQILNETTSDLRSREGLASMAAFQGGYKPGGGQTPSVVGVGEMMPEKEMPSFARGQQSSPDNTSAPAVISENHVPLQNIPEGVSALDVAKAGMVPAPVTEALTNYDRMKKILEASKGKRY